MPYFVSPSALARYFFLDCERFLRYHATPREWRARDAIPARDFKQSPIARALLEAGFAWEEAAIARLGRKVKVAAGEGPITERSHDVVTSLRLLAGLREGEAVYQPSLQPAGLHERYGLDPELVQFPVCRPDLIFRLDGRFHVVDLKASSALKASHKVQAALYVLILRDLLEPTELEKAGIWLYGQPEPSWFELGLTLPMVESFLADRLPAVLSEPASAATWHLQYRCEWCDFFPHCHEEARRVRSVSLLPYLSRGARQFLREEGVNRLGELPDYLRRPDVDSRLAGCGSLRGRANRLGNALRALEQEVPIPHGGTTLHLPRMEQVLVVLGLERDPLSGEVFLAGIRRAKGKAAFESGAEEWVACARSQSDAARVRREFVLRLHALLLTLHKHNERLPERDRLSLQVYVFESRELDLFYDLLFAALEDEQLAPLATQLLFHFQSEELASADDHPRSEVPLPIVTLIDVVRDLAALPAELVVRLDRALEAFPPPNFGWRYQPRAMLQFELSNALRSDWLLRMWSGGDDARELYERELSRRMLAASCLVDGLRARFSESLFAWPPRFQFPESARFQNPRLSRLAFVVRYECLMGALKCRLARTRPQPEREQNGTSICLQFLGQGRFRPLTPLMSSQVEVGTLPGFILVPDTPTGERDQLSYDDYRSRSLLYGPRSSVCLAAVGRVVIREADGSVELLDLIVTQHRDHPGLVEGERYWLHRRFIDFNTTRVLERLEEVDGRGGDFLEILDEPSRWSRPLGRDLFARTARRLADKAELTPSQRNAMEHVLSRRLTLIWGPPGTGKTYFLSHMISCLVRAALPMQRPFRVALTACTHSAIDHLIRGIQPLLPDVPVVKGADSATPESVVAGDTVWAFRKAFKKGKLRPFDLLVVDEGSQMKLGEFALATQAMTPEARLVLAGDDLQLPPILQGRYPEPEDGKRGLEDSIFAYLRDRDDPANPYTCQLSENWRMNETLCRFPAEVLYGAEYRPASAEIAGRRLRKRPCADRDLGWLLDPDWPLVVVLCENVRASLENLAEAELVADLVEPLRLGYHGSDREFWSDELFIVSPHHLQIRTIRRALSQRRNWDCPPFVDTVDKMQGREANAVLVSYGVADPETALGEAEFIYSLNRLNVSLTRGRRKTIACLPRVLLQPNFDLLNQEKAARGLGFMHALLRFCREHGEELPFSQGEAEFTAIRASL